jgi:CBS domain-containing protein
MDVQSILAIKGREVSTVRQDTTLGEAANRMWRERVGALVVSEDGAGVLGIVSERDVAHRVAEHGAEVLERPVRDMMTEKVFVCSPADKVDAIMELMTNRRIRHVPVVGRDGRMCGIISIGDVVKWRLDEIQSEAAAMREYIATAG